MGLGFAGSGELWGTGGIYRRGRAVWAMPFLGRAAHRALTGS
jgi:hypothetical protein